MKINSSAIASVGIALALALSGCAGAADTPVENTETTEATEATESDITIGLIVKRGTDPFAVALMAGAQESADAAGVELLTADVKQDTSLAITTVTQMIEAGVNGLIVVVPDQAIGPQVLELAEAAGIPVLALFDPISDSAGTPAPFLGLDGASLGKQAGEQLTAAINENESATPATAGFVVVSQNTISACTERTEAASAEFEAAGGLDKSAFFDVPHDGTLATAVTAMSATITQNPGITDWYITSCNDDGVAGALRALESVGVTAENSFGFGMDGSLACTELVKDNGFAGANFVSFFISGSAAFETLYALLNDGTEMPAQSAIPGPVIDRSNLAEFCE
jgi:L-arabinose transport system substrate-binding protein